MALLTRIRDARNGRSIDSSTEESVRASILQHLQAMCATRVGSMLVRPEYGLPAISELVYSFPDAASSIARALAATIEKFEPRLADVRVRHVPAEGASLVIHFEVTAVLRDVSGGGRKHPVRFATSIDPSRRVHVE